MASPPDHAKTTLRGISSMATQQVLSELLAQYAHSTGCTVAMESVGGVDAAKRVQAGEAFDLVVLGSDALDKLAASGHVLASSRTGLFLSGVAVAVRSGSPHPDLSSGEAVRRAVLAAKNISYSTGPSGVALARLFAQWGIAEELQSRIVQAPPGVPVGSLVASGEVALGFQQLSELIHLKGIDVLGPLPADIQILTTFSGAVCATSPQAAAVQDVLLYLRSPAAADAIRRQGMEPA